MPWCYGAAIHVSGDLGGSGYAPPMAQDLQRRIQAVTLLLAASSLLSRLLGYGRDWLINYQFGATGLTDAYQASFTIPDMLNYLLAGGALTTTLLPRMSTLLRQEQVATEQGTALPEFRDSDRVFSLVFTCVGVITVGLVLVGEVAATPLIRLWCTGFSADKIALTAHLTRIILPAQLFFVLGGLIQATLLARQSFRAMALTPLLYNGGIIAGGLLGGKTFGIEGFSWGALVGAALGALAIPLWSARGHLRFRPLWAPNDKEFRAFLWTALPLMIGVSLTTVDEWLGRRYGSRLAPGSISWLANARRVMLVPIGLIGSAASQATGAFIAQLFARGQRDELAQVLTQAVSGVVALSVLVSGLLYVLAGPIVENLFQYGHFSSDDARRVAELLQPLSLGIAAWSAQQVLARGFFSTGDSWRPMLLTTALTVAIVPLYAISAEHFGILGLAWSATIGMTCQAVAVGILAHRRLGLVVPTLASAVWRSLVVALLAAAVAGWVLMQCQTRLGDLGLGVHQQRVTQLVLSGTAWFVVVLAVGIPLRVPGLHGVADRFRRRFVKLRK